LKRDVLDRHSPASSKNRGTAEEVRIDGVKRVIARQLAEAMADQNISKAEVACSLQTSRAQRDRLLDPENESVTLGMLTSAAKAVGRSIKLELA